MRILNEQLRKKLIEVAEEEFFVNGFEKASLRKIVKIAGTTIGNFYNYFKNKEELFYEVTSKGYNEAVYLFGHHNEEGELLDFEAIGNLKYEEIRAMFKGVIKNVFREYHRVLVILIDGSKGTKYENTKDVFLKVMAEHMKEHLSEMSIDSQKVIHPEIGNVLAESILGGLVNIAKSKYSIEDKEELIVDYIILSTIGVGGIILEKG